MRVKVVVEYLGTRYSGWQLQRDQPTVQGEIEKALATVTGTAIRVAGSGRTDAGVHALGQVAAFDLPEGADLYRLRGSLNALTAADISVVSLEPAAADFDPRRWARSRSYRYSIVNGRPPSPFLADRAWHLRGDVDWDAIQTCAATVVGEHDFSAFRASDCEAPNPVRSVSVSRWSHSEGVWTYDIVANAFLKHMVRVLVGTMVEVGEGRLDVDDFVGLLNSKDRRNAGRTAPAKGLTLLRVDYGE